MTPQELIKIVFYHERVDIELQQYKCRKKELVQAKQRSMYLLKYFFPTLTYQQIGSYFGQKHDQAIFANNKVMLYIAHEPTTMNQVHSLMKIIQGRINNNLKAQNGAIVYKMKDKRAILVRNEMGYTIILKRLKGGDVEQKKLVVSEEVMEAIVKSYSILKIK